MSQAEELLNNLSNDEINAATINPETEEHIVVGPDRVIKVPESLKRIAVQHDHNMETVTFDCPRYWDGIDMSAMKVLINYVRADGKLGSYKAENVTVDESDNTIMHFTWTITRNVSDEDGSIAFLVCTRKTDSEGNEENHWSTELNKDLYVSPGLDCHESIAEMYPDVITYILERLGSGTGGTGEAGVGIKSIKQTKTSTESGGENIVTFTLTDNTTYTASIRNGAKGKSAYEYAKEGGYTGTEDEFKTKLSAEWATKEEFTDLSEQIANIGVGGLVEPSEDDIPKVFIDGVIPTTKDDVYAEMTYISKTDEFHAYLKIKCQGSSSMAYAKKNFTIKMYSDEARETKLKKAFKDWKFEQNKYVLKANYIDHSHARNIVSARLWNEVVASRSDYETLPTEFKASPKKGAIDGFPIKLYTNGTYQGIYTWNIGKDDWMWGMDEDNPNHILLCAELNTGDEFGETPCNFRTLWDGNESAWGVEVGANSASLKDGLNNLIECVKDTDDETFMATIGNYLDLQSAIDYWIHQYIICGLDGLAKNMLLGTYNLYSGIKANQLLKYPYYHILPFFESNGVTYTDNGDNSITMQGTTTTAESSFSLYANKDGARLPLRKGTYTLSVNASDNCFITGAVRNTNGEVIHWINLTSSLPKKTFTIDEDSFLNLTIIINPGVTIDETIYPMLNIGDTPLPFESYTNSSAKWIMGAYDMDSTFGLYWDGSKFVSAEYRCPEDYQEKYNLLFDRITTLYSDRVKDRYAELRKTVYSFSNLSTHFERFTDIISKDLYAEDLEIYDIPNGDTNNIKQIRDFIRDRLAYVDSQILGEEQ